MSAQSLSVADGTRQPKQNGDDVRLLILRHAMWFSQLNIFFVNI